jgi:hypothetical protein
MGIYKKTTKFLFIFILASIGAKAQYVSDASSKWSYVDTAKYVPTPYIAASYSILDGVGINNNYGISVSGAMPIHRSSFGIDGKVGLNSIPIVGASSRFIEGYVMVGPSVSIEISPRCTFDMRVLGGASYCDYPEQNFTQTDDYLNKYGTVTVDSSVYSTVNIHAEHVLVFTFQAGIGFKYIVSHNVGLVLNVDYTRRYSLRLTQNTTYVSATTEYTSPGSPTYSTPTYHFPVNTNQSPYYGDNDPFGFTVFSLGLCYQLGNSLVRK